MDFLKLVLSDELHTMPAPSAFGTWTNFWMVIVVAAVNGILLCLAGYKFMQVIQLSGYKAKGMFEWLKETKFAMWARLCMLSFLSCAALLITNVLLSDFFKYKIMCYIGLLFYLLFSIVFIINIFQVPQKTPLKYTHRMWRMMSVNFIIVFIATVLIVNFGSNNIPYFTYGTVGLTPALIPLFVLASHYICYPFETLNNKRFVKKATKKLDQMPDLIKIGITGSYGKTSVKNILLALLSEKYKVCASPYSYNTPLGLAKTILNDLNEKDQIFIAEMGAKNVGDIKVLCDMVKPNIGLITGIGNQHMSSFGTRENLIKTKAELAGSLAERDGKLFVNCDTEGARYIFDNSVCEKYKTAYENEDGEVLTIRDCKVNEHGSSFVLCQGKNSVKCETTLLGKHNISNILLAATVAYSLGLTLEQIQVAIRKLVPTSHRLALIPSSNSLTVIDDAYNGSVEGAKAAIEVLSHFQGKKIVITPGLVELGKEQFNSNFSLGKEMAKSIDYCIINGIVNYDALSSGLIFGGFDESHILRAGSLAQAVELLSKISVPGDVVLFENDLPDNYA